MRKYQETLPKKKKVKYKYGGWVVQTSIMQDTNVGNKKAKLDVTGR